MPSASALFDTHYGWVLDIKIFLVLIAIALGAVNRFFHVRQIKDANHRRQTGSSSGVATDEIKALLENFNRTVRTEGIVLLLILLVTSFLLQQMPPGMEIHIAHTSHQ